MRVRILVGDCREVLKTLPDESVHCVVTSPPYWGLRDYGHEGQIGLESSPQEYVERMVEVFRDVRRVLRDDGVLWLNLGDSYYGSWGNSGQRPELDGESDGQREKQTEYLPRGGWDNRRERPASSYKHPMLKPKDLVGIPWRVAFALQADGWFLRQDIIWAKPNPMPESVTDRCTKSHEYIFLLSKSARYYYDADAIAEAVTLSTVDRISQPSLYDQHGSERVPGKTNGPMKAVVGKRKSWRGSDFDHGKSGEMMDTRGGLKRSGNKERKPASARGVPIDTDVRSAGAVAGSIPLEGCTRNKRSVWTVTTKPFTGAHFATFPPDLIEPCILAGCPRGGVVLDPFGGAGTTGLVADRHGRDAILIEINPQYAELARARIHNEAPLFSEISA